MSSQWVCKCLCPSFENVFITSWDATFVVGKRIAINFHNGSIKLCRLLTTQVVSNESSKCSLEQIDFAVIDLLYVGQLETSLVVVDTFAMEECSSIQYSMQQVVITHLKRFTSSALPCVIIRRFCLQFLNTYTPCTCIFVCRLNIILSRPRSHRYNR